MSVALPPHKVYENKNATKACVACQRRKIKCVGYPCAYCLKKNYVCEFKDSCRRGPRSIKLPVLQKVDVVDNTQEAMNVIFMQHEYVNLYFQWIGFSIPRAYKQYLLSPTANNSHHRTQVYIITANVMKFFGHTNAKQLELEYISKAQKSSSLFDCDTIESAISLMMMVQYVGHQTPKGRSYILMAQQILNMLAMTQPLKGNEVLADAIQSCNSVCFISDPAKSKHQKNVFLSKLADTDLAEIAKSVNEEQVIIVGLVAMTTLIELRSKFDDSSVPEFLHSVDNSFLGENDRLHILEYIRKFDEVTKQYKDFIYANFISTYSRFIVAWRSGHTDETAIQATQLIQLLLGNMDTIIIRAPIIRVLVLPFYYRQSLLLDTLLPVIFEAYQKVQKEGEVRMIWEEMCGNLQSFSISQLESELLGS